MEQPPLDGDDPPPQWRISVTLTLRDALSLGPDVIQADLPTVVVGPLIHKRQIVALAKYPGLVLAWAFRFESDAHYWPDVTGLERISPPELQAVEAVVTHEVSRPVPGVLRALYSEPLTNDAVRWGDVGAVADALRWRRVAAPADTLWERKRGNAREIGEPVWVPVAREEPEEAPEGILTEQGWMRLEEEYLPRVCAGEHLYAHPEAKAALVIAARTYVLRAMRDHPQLGRTEPVKNSEKFQVFARVANAECVEAARLTRGIVLRYSGRLILANFVAGALWKADGSRGKDPTDTEKFVTYSAGRRGEDVSPTRLALRGIRGIGDA